MLLESDFYHNLSAAYAFTGEAMLDILRHRTYRHLFLAQVVALLGTGLATVALSLLAFDLAGDQAGQVLGTAMAIKMVAYVLIAPLESDLAETIPRCALLVSWMWFERHHRWLCLSSPKCRKVAKRTFNLQA